jgi:hypothetical protein
MILQNQEERGNVNRGSSKKLTLYEKRGDNVENLLKTKRREEDKLAYFSN